MIIELDIRLRMRRPLVLCHLTILHNINVLRQFFFYEIDPFRFRFRYPSWRPVKIGQVKIVYTFRILLANICLDTISTRLTQCFENSNWTIIVYLAFLWKANKSLFSIPLRRSMPMLSHWKGPIFTHMLFFTLFGTVWFSAVFRCILCSKPIV